MRLARFRRLAWVLVLAFLAGLAAPAFAVAPSGAGAAPHPAAHVHADGAKHVHPDPPAPDAAQSLNASDAELAKAPHHCPGCLTGAACAIACLGVALLPASVPVPARPSGTAWAAAAAASPAGASPASDLDPPRPIPVR